MSARAIFLPILSLVALILATALPSTAALASIRVTGSFNGFSINDTAMSTGTGPDLNRWKMTSRIFYTSALSDTMWKFVSPVGSWATHHWGGTGGGVDVAMPAFNTIFAANWNGGAGGESGKWTGPFDSTKWYTFRFNDAGGASTNATVMQTDNAPVTISAVNSTDTASPSSYIPVRVNVTISAAKSSQENVLVRYTTDGWATSNIIVCTFAGPTAYYADIPGLPAGTKVIFYVLTSTVTTSSDWDLQTLSYSNGVADANYTYTVQPPAKTHHTIYPLAGVFVRYGGGPQFSDTEFISQAAGARAYLTWDTSSLYAGFTGGTGDGDSYVILIDTNPGSPIGAPPTDTFAQRGYWPNTFRPDVAYKLENNVVTRYWANTAGSWFGATNVTATCTSYFGYNTGTLGTEDTIIVGIPRTNFNLNSTFDSVSIYLYAAWSGGMWANFDASPYGLDFLATDSGMYPNETTTPAAPTGLTIAPTPTSAADSFTIGWTASTDISGIGGYYYKISSAPTFDTDGTFVRGVSAAGVKATPPIGSDSVWVWAVDRNNNRSYTANLASSGYSNTLNLFPDSVVINEILAVDAVELGNSDSFSFIELYNRGASSVDIGNWTLTDYTTTWTVPGGTVLGAGKFLVQHMQVGINYTDSYGAIHIFPGSNTVLKPGTVTAMNAYGLYRSATEDSTTINDFVILSQNTSAPTVDDSHATAYGIWQNDSVAVVGVFNGVSGIRRWVDGADSNVPSDWYGGATRPTFSPGFQNGDGSLATIANIGGANAVFFKQKDYTTDTTQAMYGDTIFVTLTVTTSPNVAYIDNIPLVVYSSTDTIVVTLRETAINSKNFIGHFRIVSAAPKKDNELLVAAPDVVACTTLVRGGLTDPYGVADSLSVLSGPAAPTAVPIGLRRAANNADTVAFLAGDTTRIFAEFSDNNGPADLLNGSLFVALRRSSTDSIVLKYANGVATASNGGETLFSVITIETSVLGTSVRCTWTVTPRWTWNASSLTLSASATDSTGLSSAWTDSTGGFYYIRALAFSGALVGTGVYSGVVATNAVFRGSELITWSGLTVVYAGSAISPVSDSYFDIRIIDDNGAAATQTDSSAALSLAVATSAVTDTTEQDSVVLVNLPTGALFADTRASAQFIVDGTAPIITVNRDSYTLKAPSTDSYAPGFFDIDFSDPEGAIDTAYVWRGTDTQIITSYAFPNYTTNWNLSSTLFNALSVGINTVNVEAVDSAGNRTRKTIYVAREPLNINGDSAADWQNDEIVSDKLDDKVRITWDDTSFYFSIGGADGNLANSDWFIYIQTSSVAQADSSYTSHNWAGLGTHPLPFGANYMIGIEDGNIANSEFRSNTGGAWNASSVSNAEVYGGWADIPTTEYRIGWNRFGGKPAWMKILAFPQNNLTSDLYYGGAPETNSDWTGNGALSDYMFYSSLADTVPPDTQAVSFSISVNPTSVNVGTNFTLTVAAVNTRGETLVGINSRVLLGVSGGGTLGVTTCTFVNGIATISESITNTAGSVSIGCTAVNSPYSFAGGGGIFASTPIFVQANTVYGWHAAGLNRPDTGAADADSFMRTFTRSGVDTWLPRRRTTDNPGIFWLAKDVANRDTPSVAQLWYAVKNSGWTPQLASDSFVQSGETTWYRFILNQANAAGWDFYDTVSYFFQLTQPGRETTYIHGSGIVNGVSDSTISIGLATAQSAPFIYRIAGVSPVAPITAVSPTNGQTTVISRRPSITWAEAGDSDITTGDTIVSYYFEIGTQPDLSDSPNFPLEIGWRGPSVTALCTTTLTPYIWYYWRVKAKDTEGNVGPFSSIFSFKINAVIAVDGQLNDWNPTEKFPTYNANGFYITWDSTFLYGAWDRGSTALETTGVVLIYMETSPASNVTGTNQAINWNGAGIHVLPFNAGIAVRYLYRNIGAGYTWSLCNNGIGWEDSGLVSAKGGSEYKNASSNILEWSIPWSMIGPATTTFKIMMYVANENAGNYMYSSVPAANPQGAAPQEFSAYLAFNKNMGAASNDRRYYLSSRTWQAAGPSPASFSPIVDGVKDAAWGSSPTGTSASNRLPNAGAGDTVAIVAAGGLCRDVYVTNDAQWLYIGWQATGDVFQLDEPGQTLQSAHYGFLITDTSSYGSIFDPWKSAGTTFVSGYGADVWINLFANFGVNTFSDCNRYTTLGATWNPSDITVVNQDYGGYFPSLGQGWGEIRVPLASISPVLKAGDSIAIIHYSRHNGSKPGVDDATPFISSATSDWAVSNANLQFRDTAVMVYAIKQGVIDAYHVPDTIPVTGLRYMRSPDTPTMSSSVNLLIRAKPAGVITSASVYYSTDSGGAWSSASLAEEVQSGNATYWSGFLPTFTKDSLVIYYFQINSSNMTTYLYGTDTWSTPTASQAVAIANSFRFSVGNTAPIPVPSTLLAITPVVPSDNDTLVAAASGAADSDAADLLHYQFTWYRNGILQFSATDSYAPYTSIVAPALTSPGDTWQVFVAVSDGLETTAVTAGPIVKISTMAQWLGSLPSEINSAQFTTTSGITEWIWRDRTGEAFQQSDMLDFREIRVQADTDYIYFLFHIGAFNINTVHIAIAVDTTLDAAGGAQIGDQTSTLLDSGISSSPLRYERQIIFHATTAGAITAELDTAAGAGNTWIAPPSGVLVNVEPSAGILEARVARADLLLKGTATARFAFAVFANVVGSAATINSTSNAQPWEAPSDVYDAVSIAAVGLNDTQRVLTGLVEDFSDADLDFSPQISLWDTGVAPNLPPAATSLQTPSNGETTLINPTTFTWSIPADTDANDTVIAYLFELADAGTSLSGNVLYRVVVTSPLYALPTALTDSQYYTWHARPIDRAGNLGQAPDQTFFLGDATNILVNSPTDLQNVNNMRQMNGLDVAGTSIRWNWVTAVHSDSAPIVNYVIQIDTSVNFTPPVDSITLSSAARLYTWTNAQRGNTYYARILAYDTGTGVGASPASDGIYVSRREVNGDSSDWAPSGGFADNTANLDATYREGVWKDSYNDQRGDVANSASRDILQFQVTADPFNLYFLVPTQDFVDGQTIGQIAVSFDASSDVRAFQGNGTYAEDSFTTTKWAWEHLVRWRTGNDDCFALNNYYIATPSRYTENSSAKFVELCVPYSTLGGSDKFLGHQVAFTVATFYNNGGAVGTNGAGNSNVVDAISSGVSTWPDEVSTSDPIINYALLTTFDTGGRVTAFSGSLETASYTPNLPTQYGDVVQSERDLIMYNVFVDRFISGRSDNAPSDPNMTGGDFQGLMDSMTYFNTMGFNCIYMSPVCDFGGGAWGYNQSDLYALQYSYSDPNAKWHRLQSMVELSKKARNHNISIAMDWVPGQIYQGRTTTNHPDIISGKRFGGERGREDWSSMRQFFVDHSLTWASLGIVALRADNTKFYQPDDIPNNGLPFYRYMRKKWNEVYPQIYVFGEQPGSASDLAAYVNDGARMNGQLDFPIRENINAWINGGSTANLISGFTGNEATYGAKALMAGFIENHDHSRTYHNVGGGGDNDGSKNGGVMSNMRAAYMFAALNSQPPILFYGDEVPITGWQNATYPFPPVKAKWIAPYPDVGTEEQGQTRAFPWTWPDGTWLRDNIADYFTARCVFPEMRGSNGNRNLSQTPVDDRFMRYRRGTGDQQRIVGYINKSGGDVGGITIDLEAAGTFRDWIHPADAVIGATPTTSILKEGRLWVQAGFGRYALNVNAGEPGVIVSVDNNTAWTSITGADGKCWIYRVMSSEFPGAGTNSRTLYWWKPGYTVHSRTFSMPNNLGGDQGVLGGGETTVAFTTPDITGPPVPSGLSAVSRDRAIWLRWEPVVDFPDQDPQNHITYNIYRSQTPGDASAEWIMETLQPWYYDSNTDDFLTNGDTYYYRIRSKDRNGNLSGWSAEARAVPNKLTVKFYFTTEGTGWSGITSVKIAGNLAALGNWAPITMTQLDTSLWYFECQMDPTIMPEYKFLVNDQWEYDNIFYSNDVSYDRSGRPRLIKIVDHTGNGTAVFTNKWNVDGDVAPRQVQNAVATGGDTFISVGWTPNLEADVNRYIIRRSPDGSTWTEIGDAAITQNTFTDTNVVSATTYYYQVRAVDWWNQGGDWSATTSAQLVVTDLTPPAKPQGLTLEPVDTGSIYISWTPNSDGDMAGYYLYRSTDPGVPMTIANRASPSIIGASLSPNYTDTGVTNGVRYYYKLVAVDYSGNTSSPSDTVSAYIVALTLSCDLANISGNMEVSGNVRSLGPSPSRVTLPVYSGTVRRKTYGVLAGQALQFLYSFNGGLTVERAFNTGSQKREYTPSEISAVELIQDWEDAPEGIQNPAGYAGNQAAYLQWTSDSSVDVVGYSIERASTSDSIFRVITPGLVTATGYTDSGLTNNETYSYIIRSVDGGEIQLQSGVVRVIEVTPRAPVWIRFRVDAAPPERRLDLAWRRR